MTARRFLAHRSARPWRPGLLAVLAVACLTVSSVAAPATMQGPLRRHAQNPRYFTDASGKAILLVGAHTWNNLVDMGPSDPPSAFDFPAYLAWLERYPHNFIRLWTWELLSWDTGANREARPQVLYAGPQPWARTGSGLALDGKPRFNLEQFNPAYFDRLRERVRAAQARGIYVSVMLFEGWGLQFITNAWRRHPFHPQNNVNGLVGDLNGDGFGLELHQLLEPKVTALQEAYVRRVVDTVNEFDNVLYEIANESHPLSTPWQYHFIRFIHDYEKTKPKQHPVGMTFQYRGGSNQTLWASPADWISPNPEGGYRDNPPAADGAKVVLTDTDHLWGIGGNAAWVWKSFLRGLNPIFMDPYEGRVLSREADLRWTEPIRRSLGQALQWSRRIDLAAMTPRPALAASQYCLAHAGREYLVYLPEGQETTVDLSAVPARFGVTWFNPADGQSHPAPPVSGGQTVRLKAPFAGRDAVLYLRRAEPENP